MIIGRGEASGLNRTLLGVFPVVVRGHPSWPLPFNERERRDPANVSVNSKLSQTLGPRDADNHLKAAIAATGAETADEHMVACSDKAADRSVA